LKEFSSKGSKKRGTGMRRGKLRGAWRPTKEGWAAKERRRREETDTKG